MGFFFERLWLDTVQTLFATIVLLQYCTYTSAPIEEKCAFFGIVFTAMGTPCTAVCCSTGDGHGIVCVPRNSSECTSISDVCNGCLKSVIRMRACVLVTFDTDRSSPVSVIVAISDVLFRQDGWWTFRHLSPKNLFEVWCVIGCNVSTCSPNWCHFILVSLFLFSKKEGTEDGPYYEEDTTTILFRRNTDDVDTDHGYWK